MTPPAQPTRRAPPPVPTSSSPIVRTAAALGLAALATALFAPTVHFGFLSWDDPSYVTENAHVLQGLTWRGIWWAFTAGDAANWHPLTWLSHMLDVQLFGLAAGGHHATSVLLHAANTAILFGLLSSPVFVRQTATRSIGPAALAAALFAVHPMHVESVAWIAERKDVLSACLGLLTLWAYVRYARQPGARWYAWTLGLFALGLLAKPMLVTLPILLVLLDRWPLARGARLLEKLPFVVLSAASGVVTFLVQRHGGAVGDLGQLPWTVRIENALVSYVSYLGKLVWPARLSAFYPYPATTAPVLALGALAALAAMTTFAAMASRRRPYLLVGWLWYLAMLVPVIGLVQVGDQAMADRYSYLPFVGVFIAIAWSADAIAAGGAGRRTSVAAAAAAIVIALTVAARAQVATWATNDTLWRHALDVNPDNYRAHVGLADAFMDRGRPADAIPEYSAALRLVPTAAAIHNSLGLALTAAGRLDDAAAEYRAAAALDPGFAEAHDNLGAMLAREGRPDAAIAEYRTAIRLDPALALAHDNLGIALAAQGHIDQGIAECLLALALSPNQSQWHYHVAVMLEARGRRSEAIDHLERALALDPANAPARLALATLK